MTTWAVAALLGTAYYLTAQLNTVYADRIVPLDDLQRIDRLLSVTLPADPAAALGQLWRGGRSAAQPAQFFGRG